MWPELTWGMLKQKRSLGKKGTWDQQGVTPVKVLQGASLLSETWTIPWNQHQLLDRHGNIPSFPTMLCHLGAPNFSHRYIRELSLQGYFSRFASCSASNWKLTMLGPNKVSQSRCMSRVYVRTQLQHSGHLLFSFSLCFLPDQVLKVRQRWAVHPSQVLARHAHRPWCASLAHSYKHIREFPNPLGTFRNPDFLDRNMES